MTIAFFMAGRVTRLLDTQVFASPAVDQPFPVPAGASFLWVKAWGGGGAGGADAGLVADPVAPMRVLQAEIVDGHAVRRGVHGVILPVGSGSDRGVAVVGE